MSLTFDAAAHEYTLDDRKVRSVTGILRKVGLVDFGGIPERVLEAARTRGTAVHQAIHYFNENDLDVLGFTREFPTYAGYLQSWIRLTETGKLQAVLCEHRVASRSLRYAGTIDFLGLFEGKAAILDFATGRPEDAAKHLQTAAYVQAAGEWSRQETSEEALRAFLRNHKFIARYSVKLEKSGKLPKVTRYDDPKDVVTFMRLAEAVTLVDRERVSVGEWDWQADDLGEVA